MKKRYWAVPMALGAILAAGAVYAVELSNLHGQSCGDLTGTWHFVNNQVPAGSGTGHLDATFSGGSCSVDASKVLTSVQHFFCTAPGALLSASTDLGGRLVLSDFECEIKKCDPKTQKCD